MEDDLWYEEDAREDVVVEPVSEAERVAQRVWKQGYIEGVDKGKEHALQEGFEAGFGQIIQDKGYIEQCYHRGALYGIEFMLSLKQGCGEELDNEQERDLSTAIQVNRAMTAALKEHEFRLHIGESSSKEEQDVKQSTVTIEDIELAGKYILHRWGITIN